MTAPMQRCQVCGDCEVAQPDGRGFPPEIAKNRLAKRCASKGHQCEPQYSVGIAFPRPSFTCPQCHRTSHDPEDVIEGYCGHCHDWTTRS